MALEWSSLAGIIEGDKKLCRSTEVSVYSPLFTASCKKKKKRKFGLADKNFLSRTESYTLGIRALSLSKVGREAKVLIVT